MAEILFLILKMLATAGLLLVAVLIAAVLSRIADPAPENSSLQLDFLDPQKSSQEVPAALPVPQIGWYTGRARAHRES